MEEEEGARHPHPAPEPRRSGGLIEPGGEGRAASTAPIREAVRERRAASFFDSHCHLTDERFAGEVEQVLERAREAGVSRVVTVASDAKDAAVALALARSHDGVWATAGIHPHAADGASEGSLRRVRELAVEDGVVAIGETGLDYHYDNAPRPRQRIAFAAQLELAAELALPVVVHSRSADGDTADMLSEMAGDVRGVLHCFTGGVALLDAAIEAGWWVSFSGLVTFASFDGQGLVGAVPEERLLVETDSPYLAPVPNRGRRNEPGFLPHVVEQVARLRDWSVDDAATITARNAAEFYRLS